jgi:Mycoplasma protein of unknown function, DUF285
MSHVTDMKEMFAYTESCQGIGLEYWDVSHVKTMQGMFSKALVLEANLLTWKTSSVLDMSKMFSSAEMFNGNLSLWDTSHVTTMSSMFSDAMSFHGAGLHHWMSVVARKWDSCFTM